MSSQERLEICANINFCKEIGRTPYETYKLLKLTRGNNCVCRALVFKWHRRFSDGRQFLEDDAGRGRKSTIGPSAVTSIEEKLKADCRMTVRELSEAANVSYGTAHSILTTELNMLKVHARWVPRTLTDIERDRRVKESGKFLRGVRTINDFLNYVITTDETWLYLRDPETKTQSAVWKRAGSSPPEKDRVSRSAGKQMYMMFADCRGMSLCQTVPVGRTINAEYYSKVLSRDLIQALRKKRSDIPVDYFILPQENAPAHTAATTQLEISVLGLEVLPHPPYSPDLAPFDFAIFPELKSYLKGRRFESLRELQTAANALIHQYPVEYYRDIIFNK